MVVVPGPVEFLMGSPAGEPGRFDQELLHRRRIGRTFGIASKPVTVRQWEAFRKAHPEVFHDYEKQYSPEPDCPIGAVMWYDAAAYCRWLSEQDPTIAPDQYIYPPIAEIERAKRDGTPLRLPRDYLSRTGYRLPTEAEWEYACRAGALTSRYYGNSEALLPRYAWYNHNSQARTWPVGQKKPNDLGLFDMLGNVWQWGQESVWPYEPGAGGKPTEDMEDRREITDKLSRVLRGGSFNFLPRIVRSAHRNNIRPSNRVITFGLRPARTRP
jgi:formylglycine-generating enzyme required for sulfatase activity